ncbi:MAG: ferrochelatase [Sandaracinaceae bacterium]|nr:ferrochelatase [Sandaracinaceae bacterium]
MPFDAILLVSFGGPEGPEDVMPFLENVTRGKPVPRERLLAVAEHYQHFGGKSPINDHCRELITALRAELNAHGVTLPIYWGNRNWHPLLPDTLRSMERDGVRRALAIFTSAFSSYSGCRQYQENIAAARAEVGAHAPRVEKVRPFYNHPGFLGAVVERTREALSTLDAEQRAQAHVLFTAHSIPTAMAATCAYEAQLQEAAAFVAEAVGVASHEVVYQSRSGPPQVPWLEPDVCDHLEVLAARGVGPVVVVPIGFLSDHVEVLWDLDEEARVKAEALGLRFVRAGTVGTHPSFVAALRELVEEGLGRVAAPRFVGAGPALPAQCAPGCCAYSPQRPPAAAR